MQLLYFGWVRSKIGVGGEEIDLPAEVADIRGLIEWLFARFAHLVRNPEPAPDTESFGSRDFPVGEAGDDCLDLLAICRRPR